MPIIDPKTDLRSLSYKEFGTIGDPLVVKDIPGVNQDGPSKGVLKQVTARTDDALRMTRLLVLQGGKRNPAGNKFTANLALLNQQETISKARKLEKGNFKEGLKNVGKSFLGGAADTGKTIGSILAQVPVAGTGTHFVNGGKVGKEYLKGGGNSIGNFLRSIVGAEKGLQGHERVLSGQPITITKSNTDSGVTSLKSRYSNTNPESFIQQEVNLFTDKLSSESKDAVKTRLRYQGDPNNPSRKNLISVDQINASDIVQEDFFNDKDIIPFEFQIFDPVKQGEPDYVYFRAYLDTFNDDFTGEWAGTKYVGRAENLYNYQGFNRSISFGFKIAAHTREELQPLYRKLNYLVGTTSPSYSKNETFMRGIYAKVSIGDYLSAVPGFFESISISWDKSYPWEVGLNLEEHKTDIPRVPHVLDISITYKPVHNFNPSINKSFITNDKYTKSNPLPTLQVKPETLGAAERVRELNLLKDTLAFPFKVQPSEETIPKVNLTNLNDVPQRSLDTVQVPGLPPRANLGTRTQLPLKKPLPSNPFGT